MKPKKRERKRARETHGKPKKRKIRMISTRQCSLFTIACPIPECFEKEGRKLNNEQKGC